MSAVKTTTLQSQYKSTPLWGDACILTSSVCHFTLNISTGCWGFRKKQQWEKLVAAKNNCFMYREKYRKVCAVCLAMTMGCRHMKDVNTKKEEWLVQRKKWTLVHACINRKHCEIFAHEVHLPKQTGTRSQGKMPFRDKNQTVQINRNVQGGMLLHRIRVRNKSFFSTDISVSLVKDVLCWRRQRKLWSL